jgi:hypothetical protein
VGVKPGEPGLGLFVAELVIPGSRISPSDIDEPGRRFEVRGQLGGLVTLLDEVAVALRFYEVARASNRARYERARQDSDEVRRRVCESQLWLDEAGHEQALADARRKAWLGGVEPMEYVHQVPTMYARAVVVALDRFAKTLAVFDKDIGRDAVAAARKRLDEGVPGLRDTRNNIAHIEDRARGLKVGEKPIDLKPASTSMVQASGGGVLVVEGLDGDTFCGTGASGQLVGVEVSRANLCLARDSLQDVLNAFSWKGPKRHHPG